MKQMPRPAVAQAGGYGCVGAAWQAHGDEIRAFLRRRLGDAHAADDVLQDVFFKAMRQGKAFCALDDPRAWLYKVARNALVDRSRTAHPAEPIEPLAEVLPAHEADPVPAVDALTGCLQRVLGELSAADADVLRACDIEGQTQGDYAQAHGLSLPAVKSRLLRGRERLRRRLVQVCRVRFDGLGQVSGHEGRAAEPEPDPGA
jgi:RNA polymerase sigma-70 factor (ECF subfamily)